MAVETDFSRDEKKLTIKVKGRFDFGRHQEFRSAYERQPERPDTVVVDLKEATYGQFRPRHAAVVARSRRR